MFFLSLEYCSASTTCTNKGDCKTDGTCDCDTNYYGNDCSSRPLLIFILYSMDNKKECGIVNVNLC